MDEVTFELARAIDPIPARAFRAELHCDDRSAARVTLVSPGRTKASVGHRVAGRLCTIRQSTAALPGRVDEV
ncbi:MAG TPA: hypothetical protein VI076_04775, partial [Actinopolymorphaceae bacterium]